MRGLVFWLVIALTISGGSWLYAHQERQQEMLPGGSKLLAVGEFSLPVGGVAKVYHLPDGQGRIVFEKLKVEKGLRLQAFLAHKSNTTDFNSNSLNLGELKNLRIQALDIPPQARSISYSVIILVRQDQQDIWAETKLRRAY